MGSISLTDAIMISFPAPEDPPMIATIKLGTIAKLRVKKFLIHGVSFKSRNPYKREAIQTGNCQKMETIKKITGIKKLLEIRHYGVLTSSPVYDHEHSENFETSNMLFPIYSIPIICMEESQNSEIEKQSFNMEKGPA